MSLREKFFNALGPSVQSGLSTYFGLQDREDALARQAELDAERAALREEEAAEKTKAYLAQKRFAGVLAQRRPDLGLDQQDALAMIEAGMNPALLTAPEEDPSMVMPQGFLSAIQQKDLGKIEAIISQTSKTNPDLAANMQRMVFNTTALRPDEPQGVGRSLTPNQQFAIEDRKVSTALNGLLGAHASRLPIYNVPENMWVASYNQEKSGEAGPNLVARPNTFDAEAFRRDYISARERSGNPEIFDAEFFNSVGRLGNLHQMLLQQALQGESAAPKPPSTPDFSHTPLPKSPYSHTAPPVGVHNLQDLFTGG